MSELMPPGDFPLYPRCRSCGSEDVYPDERCGNCGGEVIVKCINTDCGRLFAMEEKTNCRGCGQRFPWVKPPPEPWRGVYGGIRV